ncbi:MAG: dTDP-glucose 4,6-dehydratase [Deltaproteobacteria bacterium]|nr:dTDP-glucose 4,6-dehydratase [Deltaproteobacteria bacterium]
MTRPLSRLLVTGGCGFIGSAFIRRLFGREDFTGSVVNLDLLTYAGNPANLDGAVDPERYTFVHGDIADAACVSDVMTSHNIDTVVNFAAETHVDRSIHGPGAFLRSNYEGTFVLLQACRESGAHFHQISTDEVFGSLGDDGAFAEGDPFAPNSPYAATKAGADHLVRAWHHTYGVSVTVSHCSNNYGPCQFPEKLIPLMLLNALGGKPLPVYGDGGNVRDWLHVDDHGDAVLAILRGADAGTSWNIGGRCERTNLQVLGALLDAVAEQAPRDRDALESLITFVADRPGHDWRYAVDCSRIEAELGWAPQVEFSEGLKSTVRWYLEHPEWVEGVRSGVYRQWLERNYTQRSE